MENGKESYYFKSAIKRKTHGEIFVAAIWVFWKNEKFQVIRFSSVTQYVWWDDTLKWKHEKNIIIRTCVIAWDPRQSADSKLITVDTEADDFVSERVAPLEFKFCVPTSS